MNLYNSLLCIFSTPRFKSRLIALSSMLLLLLMVACDDNSNDFNIDATPPIIVSNPSVIMAPNPNTPLAGLLELETDEPTTVSVTITENSVANNSQRGIFEPTTIEFDELATDHSLTLLGFTPGKTFSIEVKVTDRHGNQSVFDDTILVNTDPLPEDFPPIEVTSDPARMEPGVTMFDIGARGANASFGEAIIIVNESGDVVWYHKPIGGVSDMRMLSNGNLLFISSVPNEVVEMDMLGNIVISWNSSLTSGVGPESIPVMTDRFHHEVFKMENGNMLVLSVELVVIDNYPSSESNPTALLETAFVAGDLVVEFSSDGTIVNEWSILDLLDPFRIGYNSLGGFWNNLYPDITQGTRDWSHGNAVIYDPSDDSIIVSLRHQDAVIKFKRDTGELVWILGPHENWDQELFGQFLLTPVGDNFIWQYHQHAPMITPDGTLLIYDNGNNKASPFDEKLPAPENFSRAVQYAVDETNMEIRQVWEYGEHAEEAIFTPFIGDADYMTETGNVLICFGGITIDEEGIPTDSVVQSKASARILEVTHETPAEVVFDLSIVDDTPEFLNGWTVYRAERLSSLYP